MRLLPIAAAEPVPGAAMGFLAVSSAEAMARTAVRLLAVAKSWTDNGMSAKSTVAALCPGRWDHERYGQGAEPRR